jgi:hypothetical protein
MFQPSPPTRADRSTFVAQIAAEARFMPTVSVGACSLYKGPCPLCGGEAFAWDYRSGRPDDAWLCLRCNAHGSLFNLSRLARAAA